MGPKCGLRASSHFPLLLLLVGLRSVPAAPFPRQLDLDVIREVPRRIAHGHGSQHGQHAEGDGRKPSDAEAVCIPVAGRAHARLERLARDPLKLRRLSRHADERLRHGLHDLSNRRWRHARGDGRGCHSLRHLLLRRLPEDGREEHRAYGAADRPERPDQSHGDAQVPLRYVERGRRVAVDHDPAPGEEGEELDRHDPVDVVWGDERHEAEEQHLHGGAEDELAVHALHVVREGWYEGPAYQLAHAVVRVSDVPFAEV